MCPGEPISRPKPPQGAAYSREGGINHVKRRDTHVMYRAHTLTSLALARAVVPDEAFFMARHAQALEWCKGER